MTWSRLLVIWACIISNLGSMFLLPLIYVDFELRQDYIAKVLCVERNKPMTVCYGRCYLNKNLGKAAEQTENEEKTLATSITFFFHKVDSLLSSTPLPGSYLKNTHFVFRDLPVPILRSSNIFHPPQV